MNVALWIVQAVLAAAFIAVGAGKLAQSKLKLLKNPQMAWVEEFPEPALKALGAVEVLAAIGVVVPWLAGVATVLTPVAAVVLGLLCLTSVPGMLRREQYATIAPNAVLLVLAAFVAWGRF
ncbi:DoxX family protein [Dactylosporangium vinaceum]|uniref:DoxX family protein n=1 Tax=Dactylosporangium vinaceum TaxID=53362 RepID=A0ABV5MKM8_9ACTN|nr:DoxX family protein [Dactylosporangium vinaceum]UAB93894.1 DoxX family protein [Dactylosporangium vinaceum]